MRWYRFWDMSAGGTTKWEPFDKIYVQERSEEAACDRFKALTGENPDDVWCSCCGANYSLSEHSTLRQATAYHRGCTWNPSAGQYFDDGEDLQAYLSRPTVYVLRLTDWIPARQTD